MLNLVFLAEQSVTCDPIEAAYFGVYVWKAAVEKCGSFDVDKVRKAVYGLEFDAPGGKKSMHPTNQHTLKPVYMLEKFLRVDSSKLYMQVMDWFLLILTVLICGQMVIFLNQPADLMVTDP